MTCILLKLSTPLKLTIIKSHKVLQKWLRNQFSMCYTIYVGNLKCTHIYGKNNLTTSFLVIEAFQGMKLWTWESCWMCSKNIIGMSPCFYKSSTKVYWHTPPNSEAWRKQRMRSQFSISRFWYAMPSTPPHKPFEIHLHMYLVKIQL